VIDSRNVVILLTYCPSEKVELQYKKQRCSLEPRILRVDLLAHGNYVFIAYYSRCDLE